MNRCMRVLQTQPSDAEHPEGATTYDAGASDLPPGLPELDGHQEISADPADLPRDLSRLASIWPTLPDHIRAAIVAQAESYGSGTGAPVDAGRQAWLLLPEETRASIIESIGNAMKDLLEKERRQDELLEKSMAPEEDHIEER